jgi:hypothetical protein
MIRFVVGIPLILHGLANLTGVFAPWIKGGQGFKDAAWIFSPGVTYFSWVGKAFSLVWLASTICLVLAGIGAILQQPWWQTIAILGCSFSLLAIVPWWRAVVAGAYVGAIFDVLVIAVLISPLGVRIAQAVA